MLMEGAFVGVSVGLSVGLALDVEEAEAVEHTVAVTEAEAQPQAEELGEAVTEGERDKEGEALGDGVMETLLLICALRLCVVVTDVVTHFEAAGLREPKLFDGSAEPLTEEHGVPLFVAPLRLPDAVAQALTEALPVPQAQADGLCVGEDVLEAAGVPVLQAVPLRLAKPTIDGDCVPLTEGDADAEAADESEIVAVEEEESEEVADAEKNVLRVTEELAVGDELVLAEVVPRSGLADAELVTEGERDALGEPLTEGETEARTGVAVAQREAVLHPDGERDRLPLGVAQPQGEAEGAPERVGDLETETVLHTVPLALRDTLAQPLALLPPDKVRSTDRVAQTVGEADGDVVTVDVLVPQREALAHPVAEGSLLGVAEEETQAEGEEEREGEVELVSEPLTVLQAVLLLEALAQADSEAPPRGEAVPE